LAADTIADDLVARGWSEQQSFLSDELTLALADECRSLSRNGALAAAAVGRHGAQALQPAIRGDHTAWLHAGQSLACDRYLTIMESLRLSLNRSLFLGLDNYESHFACFGPGTGYQRHLDRFYDDDHRAVSVVIYLNAGWLAADGGALRLHPAAAAVRDIAPVGSRIVVFMSRERLSLAGWFRRR
jgi:SM-20-related protein